MATRRKRSQTRAKAKAKGYRSGFEQSIAEQAKKDGIKYDYEPKDGKIEWTAAVKTYLPDFVLANGVIVEAKGRLTVHDRVKHLAIQSQHPHLDIRFVFQYDNKITRTSNTRYSDWCEKNGFQYAMKTIPKEWARAKGR